MTSNQANESPQTSVGQIRQWAIPFATCIAFWIVAGIVGFVCGGHANLLDRSITLIENLQRVNDSGFGRNFPVSALVSGVPTLVAAALISLNYRVVGACLAACGSFLNFYFWFVMPGASV